ncbi:transposase family protein [Streptomyces sp. NPDC059629]|uniref:transposase family protein n=1 Tax=Streptomyces sp. NPDC059629 TaxID=3346889 RepID=UPI00369177E4
MRRQSATVSLTKSPTAAQRAAHGIAEWLGVLRDPRGRSGRRHALVAVLLTACCAVLAGARSNLAIGQWGRHAPQDTLAPLGLLAAGPPGVRRAPSGSTIRRILTLVCPGGLADLLGCDPAGARVLAVAGKCARGLRTDAAPAATCCPPCSPGDAPSVSCGCRTRAACVSVPPALLTSPSPPMSRVGWCTSGTSADTVPLRAPHTALGPAR